MAPSPAPATRWPGLLGAVIALVVVAVVAGNRVWGIPSQEGIIKQNIGSRNSSEPEAATAADSGGLDASVTLQNKDSPLLLFCNATSACSTCVPSDDCTGFRQQLLCHVDAANSSSPVQHQVTRAVTKEGQRRGLGAQFEGYYNCKGSDASETRLSSFESGMLCLLVFSLPVVLYRKRSGKSLLPL